MVCGCVIYRNFARLKDGLNPWFLQYVLSFCDKKLACIEEYKKQLIYFYFF
ncbi:hypothetical protein Aasi_1577 [Candidatus Amoebophilus asiaticus 5a2]|uniref:Uncharacterized protein n=1 Tax=Amoebophilus asiaticus (strain 5a2) TaxID=452471 RepID=C3L4I7_AMOA5|nr:hypothetical protein Aasi_1577 [Candidatus Amoebophilus asiaticus 5a2]